MYNKTQNLLDAMEDAQEEHRLNKRLMGGAIWTFVFCILVIVGGAIIGTLGLDGIAAALIVPSTLIFVGAAVVGFCAWFRMYDGGYGKDGSATAVRDAERAYQVHLMEN